MLRPTGVSPFDPGTRSEAPMSRRLALVGVLGALLLLGSPLAWSLSQPDRSVGDLDAVAGTADEAAPPTVADDRSADLPAPAPSGAASPPPIEPAHPTRVAMAERRIDAPLVAVGLEPSGAMQLPADVREVGWYEPGVVPGAGGTAVLAGHVDARTQGPGALFELRRSVPGELLEITHADGSTTTWRVTARTAYAKDELPIADIFTRFGPSRLAVITCGGRFDAATGHYDDNVVVYAEPVADEAATAER